MPTTIFSAGDPSSAKSGPMQRDAASAPRPTDAFLRKSRRSKGSFGCIDIPELQGANLDASEIHLVNVILKHDVARALIGETFDVAVFAPREKRVHQGSAELELVDLPPIQPMLAMISAKHYRRGVPLTHWCQHLIRVRSNEIEQRAG